MNDKYCYTYILETYNGDLYIGVTSNLKNRLASHNSRNGQSDHPFKDYAIAGIFKSKQDAMLLETDLILHNDVINSIVSILTPDTRQESYKAYSKKYRESSKGKMFWKKYRQQETYKHNHAKLEQNVRDGEMMMFGKTNMKIYRRMFK